MDEQQKRYYRHVRIDELKRCIDTILGKPKGTHTKQDIAVLKDARQIYKDRMGEGYR